MSEPADGQTDNEQASPATPDQGTAVIDGQAGHAAHAGGRPGRCNAGLDPRRWHRPSAERDDLPSLFDSEER